MILGWITQSPSAIREQIFSPVGDILSHVRLGWGKRTADVSFGQFHVE